MISYGISKLGLAFLGDDNVDLFSMDSKIELSAETYVGYSPRVNIKFQCPDSITENFVNDESKFKLIIGQKDAIESIDLVLTDFEFEGSSITLQLAPSKDYLFESLFLQEDSTALKFIEKIYKRYFKDVKIEAKDQASTKMKWTSLGSSPMRSILEASMHNTEPILSGVNFDGSVVVRDLTYYKSNKEGHIAALGGGASLILKSALFGARRAILTGSYNNDYLNVDANGEISLKSQGIYGRNLIGSRFESKNVYKGYYENNQKCLDLYGKLASECYSCNVIDLNGVHLLDQVVPVANSDNSNNNYLESRMKRSIISGIRYYFNSELESPELIKTIYMNPIQEVLDVQ